jgi:hypothetical protein
VVLDAKRLLSAIGSGQAKRFYHASVTLSTLLAVASAV